MCLLTHSVSGNCWLGNCPSLISNQVIATACFWKNALLQGSLWLRGLTHDPLSLSLHSQCYLFELYFGHIREGWSANGRLMGSPISCCCCHNHQPGGYQWNILKRYVTTRDKKKVFLNETLSNEDWSRVC